MGGLLRRIRQGDGDNWYAYAGNNPVNATDPSGLRKISGDELIKMMQGDSSWNGGDCSFGKTGSLSYTTNDGSTNTITSNSGDTPSGNNALTGMFNLTPVNISNEQIFTAINYASYVFPELAVERLKPIPLNYIPSGGPFYRGGSDFTAGKHEVKMNGTKVQPMKR